MVRLSDELDRHDGSMVRGLADVPERVVRAVELLDLQPDEHLLEIGCGNGAAVSLICDRLRDGAIVGIDRSPIQIERGARRNARHIAEGKAAFRVAEPKDLELDEGPFTKVFAINVNLFWTRPAPTELDRIKLLLEPGGGLYLFYDPPAVEKRKAIVDRLVVSLSAAGFEPITIGLPYLAGVVARLR